MWIVMTSSARMPSSVRARYRNVALVKLDQHATARNLMPRKISTKDKSVLQVIHYGHFHVGSTDRAAYQRMVIEAQRRARQLNNTACVGDADQLLMTWGGSA